MPVFIPRKLFPGPQQDVCQAGASPGTQFTVPEWWPSKGSTVTHSQWDLIGSRGKESQPEPEVTRAISLDIWTFIWLSLRAGGTAAHRHGRLQATSNGSFYPKQNLLGSNLCGSNFHLITDYALHVSDYVTLSQWMSQLEGTLLLRFL